MMVRQEGSVGLESRLVDLTSIPRRIHCAATDATGKHEKVNELDRITIDHFLDTLAEVALAIARRREQLDQ